jgi:molybdate transport system substrate-binding protein
MRTRSAIAAAAMLGCLGVANTGAARADEVVLMTTGAVEQIMKDLIPSFERASGHTVAMNVYGTGPRSPRSRKAPSPISSCSGPTRSTSWRRPARSTPGTVTPVFNSRIGLAVRAGAKRPDIGSDEALKQALLDAKSIGFSIGPSGEHFSKVIIAKLGIADQLRPKMTNIRGAPVGAGVARGEVEVGIHQIAELLPIAGIDIVGDLPADLNKTIVYATGLTTMVKHPDAANALVKYLSLPSAAPVIQKNGMNPVDVRR